MWGALVSYVTFLKSPENAAWRLGNVSRVCYYSLKSNERLKMNPFTVACLNYEVCGAKETFEDESEYEIYGDDYMCAECYAADEYHFFETIGWSDSDALTSAGLGMDEDY
jgi:hypothetical protein